MNIYKISASYIRNKNQSSFSKFNSWLSIIGIVIGVTALIVVSSVMNGIFEKIHDDLNIKTNYDMSISGFNIDDIKELKLLIGEDNIKSQLLFKELKSPYKSVINNKTHPISIVDNELFKKDGLYLNSLLNNNYKGIFINIYKNNEFLDQDLFKVNSFSVDDIDNLPIGLNNILVDEDYFNNNLYIDYETKNVINFKFKDFMDTEIYSLKINEFYKNNKNIVIDNWYDDKIELLKNLKIEGTVIKIVLFFIILMSSFSIMSTLSLIISEKKQDIYILKTIGYTDKNIVSIFLISGLIIGIVGIILGSISGFLISTYLKEILSFFELTLRVNLFPEELKYFPVIIDIKYFINISILTLATIFISSLLPSLKTLKITPAEGLKSE